MIKKKNNRNILLLRLIIFEEFRVTRDLIKVPILISFFFFFYLT